MSELSTSDDRSRPPEARAAISPRLVLLFWQVMVIVAWLCVWQLIVSLQLVDAIIAKSPRQVFAFIWQSASSGELWFNAYATMKAVFIAFALASIVGILVGISLGLLGGLERVLTPFLDALNAMPRIALAPVFVVALGIGIEAKVALAFSVVVFVVLSSAQAGVRSADPEILRMSTVFGITRFQLFYKVLLPVSVPAIFSGLRLGLVYALLGVIGSEIIASQEGLGQLIARYSGEFRMDAVYGILIVLAIIASLLNMVSAAAERWLLRWRAPGV